MMFITEIDIQTIEGKIETHEGPIITAKTLREAKLKAKTMNSDLRIVGEYCLLYTSPSPRDDR